MTTPKNCPKCDALLEQYVEETRVFETVLMKTYYLICTNEECDHIQPQGNNDESD